MTNEEIAKDLAVALIGKMTNPTVENVSETYHAILQGINETKKAMTLQNIEDHLTKQDKNSFESFSLTLKSFIGTIIITALILSLTGLNQANALLWDGLAIAVLGIIIYFLVSWRLKKLEVQIKNNPHTP